MPTIGNPLMHEMCACLSPAPGRVEPFATATAAATPEGAPKGVVVVLALVVVVVLVPARVGLQVRGLAARSWVTGGSRNDAPIRFKSLVIWWSGGVVGWWRGYGMVVQFCAGMCGGIRVGR